MRKLLKDLPDLFPVSGHTECDGKKQARFPCGKAASQDESALFHGEGAAIVAVFLHDTARGDAGRQHHRKTGFAELHHFRLALGRDIPAAEGIDDQAIQLRLTGRADDIAFHAGPAGHHPDLG